jgi:hypothetical protein
VITRFRSTTIDYSSLTHYPFHSDLDSINPFIYKLRGSNTGRGLVRQMPVLVSTLMFSESPVNA